MISFKTLLSDREILEGGTFGRLFSSLKPPAVSVVMTTYCRGQTSLRRAIDSVLNQTFSDFELIIADDGSWDGTFEILKEYQKKDSRIIIIRHRYNSGLPAARIDEAILFAKGRYIAYQFDDDEWLPDCLATLYGEIVKHDEPCAVYGTCEAQVKMGDGSIAKVSYGREFDYGALQSHNIIANNSILHPKEVFEQCGLYDPHVLVRRLSDYDLWLRMAKKIKFIWIDKKVSKVFGGEKNSLAEEDGIVLQNYGKLRKYVEIDRDEMLKPHNISNYEVDDMDMYRSYYRQEEIDAVNRKEIIPYRTRTTYYLTEEQINAGNISRPKICRLALTKGSYSTSIDVTVKNFACRLKCFPYRCFFINEDFLNLGMLETNEYDVFGLYRTIGNSSTEYLRVLKEAGKPAAYFMDDNMFKFYELGDEFSYLKPGTSYYKNLEKQVADCDLVVSYNMLITKQCRNYNSRVAECGTNIPGKYLSYKSCICENDRIKICILAGPSRRNEMRALFPILEKFSKQHEFNAELHFWGIDPNEFGKLHCKTVYREFTNSYDQYLERLQSAFFHFVLCPLSGMTDAAKSKSPVKFLEGTAAGAVLVCSNVPPYSLLPDDVCIKTGNSPKEWEDVLNSAVIMPETERLSIYKKAYDYIKQNYTTECMANRFLGVLGAVKLHNSLKNKKIAYFFHEAYLGGATLHLLKHALYMREFGFDVMLCVLSAHSEIPYLREKAADFGLELHHLPYLPNTEADHAPDAYECSLFIEDWIKSNNIGLAHSVTYIEAVGIACKNSSIPHVATLHRYYGCKLSKEEIRNNKIIDYIHSSSNRYADEWSRCLEVPARKICCPVESEYFDCYKSNAEKWADKPETVNILLSGSIQPRKNQLEAIKAVKMLIDKGYSINLTLIGYNRFHDVYMEVLQDYINACENFISSANLQNRVKIPGFEPEPVKYYRDWADMLLCCSKEESMPQTVLQAMAAGVLAVTAEVGGIREIIKNRYNGVIFEGTDACSIAEGIESAILLPRERIGSMLLNAYNSVKMVSHPEHVKSELIDLYNEAVIEKSRNKRIF